MTTEDLAGAEADTTDLTLADQVRARLERDGLSLEAAADQIGIPTARLIAMLQGAAPNFSTQGRIGAWLASEASASTEPSPVAAAEPRHASLPRFDRIFIGKLRPSPNNPRRITDDHPSLPELAASIEEHDVLEPLLVRDLGDDGFEIMAGERRWRAARLAKLEKVPCLIRTCDDQTAFEITVTENLQRENLHWLEEARGVELMTKKGWGADVIAKQLGKSPAWVAVRSKLAHLSPKWLTSIEEGKNSVNRWPLTMIEEVAKYPVDAQEAMLEQSPLNYRVANCETAAELRRILAEDFLHLLKSAPFPTDDAKLVPSAGACTACPKRSSCQQALFTEAKADTCLDGTCWDEKAAKHQKAVLAELKKENPKAVLAAKDHHAARDVKGAMSSYDWEPAKPTDKGAKLAIIVADGKAPRLGHIVTGGGAAASRRGETPTEASPKDRLEQFMKRRSRAAIEAVLVKLGAPKDSTSINHYGDLKDASADVTRPGRATLIRFALAFGIEDGMGWDDFKKLGSLNDSKLDEELWEGVRRSLVSDLIGDKMFSCDTTGAKVVAEACGLNWRAMVDSARDSNPLTKSLAAHFDESGQPLKGVAKNAKAGKAGG